LREKGRINEKVTAIITKKGGEKMIINKKNYNILAVVKDKFGNVKAKIKGANIITNDGDLFYAQKGAGEATTYEFANCVLGSGDVAEGKTDTYDTMTPIGSTEKAPSAGYPKTNDVDANNPDGGVDVVTYKYEWAKADFNAASIAEGCITIATPEAGSKVLTRFKFAAAFPKTADDTLAVFVNHELLGV